MTTNSEIQKARELLLKQQTELVDMLTKSYEDRKDQTEKDLAELPDWLKFQVMAQKAENPVFILTDFVGTVFAMKEAVKLAANFTSRSEWHTFLKHADFDKYGGLAEGHSDGTVKLMMGVANKIVERTCPDIKIATTTEMPKPHLRLVKDD